MYPRQDREGVIDEARDKRQIHIELGQIAESVILENSAHRVRAIVAECECLQVREVAVAHILQELVSGQVQADDSGLGRRLVDLNVEVLHIRGRKVQGKFLRDLSTRILIGEDQLLGFHFPPKKQVLDLSRLTLTEKIAIKERRTIQTHTTILLDVFCLLCEGEGEGEFSSVYIIRY